MALIDDKYKKWIIAGFSSFLMVAFTLPSWFGSGHGPSRAEVTQANIFGDEKLTDSEIRTAKEDLEILAGTVISERPPITLATTLLTGSPSQFGSPADLQFAVQAADRVLRQWVSAPELFALARREALRQGVVVNRDRVEEILRNYMGITDTDTPQKVDRFRAAAYSMVLVQTLGEQNSSAVKITRPELQSRLAQQLQSLRVTVAVVDSDKFTEQVPAPTDDQLRDQFLKFGSRPANDPDARTNPFGFAYLQGDRVKTEYITLSRAALLRAARLSRSDYDWEVEAQKYYVQNQKQFTRSATSATTAPSAGDLKPFPEVRQQVLDRLVDTKADQLTTQVTKRLTAQLAADYRAYAEALAKTQPPPTTSVGVPFNSPDYLRALATRIETETGVRAEAVTSGDRYLTGEDLSKDDRLGQSRLAGANGQTISFDRYVLLFAKPFFASSGASRIPGAAPLELYEPTPVFSDASGGVYMARVLDAKPSRVPQLDEVREQVRKDVVARGAQDRAVAFAETLSAEGPAQSLSSLAASRGLRTVTIPSLRASTALPFDLPLSPVGRSMFIDGCYNLLRADPAVERPRVVISLPRDRKVVVAELEGVEQLAPNIEPALLELQSLQLLRSASQLGFLLRYFDAEAIISRTGFKPTDNYRGPLAELAAAQSPAPAATPSAPPAPPAPPATPTPAPAPVN